MHIFLVQNPVSGTTDPQVSRETFERHFSSRGISYDVHETQAGEPVHQIVQRAVSSGKYDLVVAAGGDGTVSAVANGLVRTEIPLAVLPLGSGNALAREMMIPLVLEQALDLITGAHDLVGLDLIDAGERHFLLSLSAGLSAKTMQSTTRDEKRRLGKAAYVLEGFNQFFGLNLDRYEIDIDGKRVQARASEVFIANVGLVGFRQFRVSPKVQPDDGTLHVCIVRTKNLPDYIRLFSTALIGRAEHNPELVVIPGKDITITSDRPRPVQGDGEVFGSTPVHAQVVPRAVRLVVPPGSRK